MKILLRVVDEHWWTPTGRAMLRIYLPSCVPYQPTLSRALYEGCRSADDVDRLINRLSDGRQAFGIQNWDYHVEGETVLVSSQDLPERIDIVSRKELIEALKDYSVRLRSDPSPDEVRIDEPGCTKEIDTSWCTEDHSGEVIGHDNSSATAPQAEPPSRPSPPSRDDGFGR